MSWDRNEYLAHFSAPKGDTGDHIHLIYFALQLPDSIELKRAQGGAKIFPAVRNARTQIGIDPAQNLHRISKICRDEGEPLMGGGNQ